MCNKHESLRTCFVGAEKDPDLAYQYVFPKSSVRVERNKIKKLEELEAHYESTVSDMPLSPQRIVPRVFADAIRTHADDARHHLQWLLAASVQFDDDAHLALLLLKLGHLQSLDLVTPLPPHELIAPEILYRRSDSFTKLCHVSIRGTEGDGTMEGPA